MGATDLVNATHWPANTTERHVPPACRVNGTFAGACTSGGTTEFCAYGSAGGCFWTGGGGKSALMETPWYQWQEVGAYDADTAVPKPPGYWLGGHTIPHLSLMAHNYAVSVGGSFMLVDGTSASSPALSGLLNRVNDARVAANKSHIAFASPSLFKIAREVPGSFVSVDKGYNGCTEEGCYPHTGYYARPGGFDPVTGLGVPNFELLGPALVAL